jgi:glycosyltransferase involved in cell wall biosynthesis
VSAYRRRENRNGIRQSLGLPSDALVVTYAGRLHPAKGVDTLLAAFAVIAGQRRSHLVLAGRAAVVTGVDGRPCDYRGELRSIAARLGIDAHITWIAHQRDIAALFTASDVTVLPSVWSEPFGRVVIESMACETPVVASRVGGIAEILTGEFAVWMFEPGQADALAGCLLAACRQAADDPAIGQRARAHVACSFSVDRTLAGVERVLVSTARRQPGRRPSFFTGGGAPPPPRADVDASLRTCSSSARPGRRRSAATTLQRP